LPELKKDALKAAASTAVGGTAGAALYGAIGGVGVTAVGTGIGITLGPFIVIGAGLGATSYGIFWLGKQLAKKNNR